MTASLVVAEDLAFFRALKSLYFQGEIKAEDYILTLERNARNGKISPKALLEVSKDVDAIERARRQAYAANKAI